jgi:mannose-1-phosphate guanylyltransferase
VAVAILLVGGFGTRLMPLTRNTPKPMLTVAGIPVTEHQLLMAKAAGITKIVLATSYLSDVFTPYFGDGSKWGLSIKKSRLERAVQLQMLHNYLIHKNLL